jgi:hypothetical protein
VRVGASRLKAAEQASAGNPDARAGLWPAELRDQRPEHFAPHDGASLRPPRTARGDERIAYVIAGLGARQHRARLAADAGDER